MMLATPNPNSNHNSCPSHKEGISAECKKLTFSKEKPADYNFELSQISHTEGIHRDIQVYTHMDYLRPMIPRTLDFNESYTTERACMDTYCSGNPQFCKLYKVSGNSRSVMIGHQQEPEDCSPSKPFFVNPHLGVQTILNTVFRGQREVISGPAQGKKAVFTCWVVCPSNENDEALAFTAGHSFTKQQMGLKYLEDFGDDYFSEFLGCFGTDVGRPEFANFGFACSPKPLAVVNDGDEDLALFSFTSKKKKLTDFLLPCSAELECVDNKKFMATFTYPCTQTFLLRAYEELVEDKHDHGIMDLYGFLGLDKAQLYKLLWDTFESFHDGHLVCSPGVVTTVDGPHCYYKCSTVGGSSGGPIIPTHLPGYSIGNHDGALKQQDYNVATSTDSPAYVIMWSHFVLPRLPSKDSRFWTGWNLAPFERWLQKHNLVWRDNSTTWVGESWQKWKALLLNGGWDSQVKKKKEKLKCQSEVITPPPTLRVAHSEA